MKRLLLLSVLSSMLILFASSCKKDKDPDTTELFPCEPILDCFKGRLEIKDICGNYTISVVEGNIDPSLIQSSWIHPKTNATYSNVFTLGNICSFPTTIKEGDEFYFQVRDNKKDATCVQCLAYVPTPDKVLSINASTTPCYNASN